MNENDSIPIGSNQIATYLIGRPTIWWLKNFVPHVVGILALVAIILFGYTALNISNSQICFYLILSTPILILGIGGLVSDFDIIRIEITEEGISNPQRSIREIMSKENKYIPWHSIQKVRIINRENVSNRQNDRYSIFAFLLFWDGKMIGFRRNDIIKRSEACEILEAYCKVNDIDIEHD